MWKIGDRVLAGRPGEKYWYPGTVRHIDGNRFYVIFDDGEDALVTLEQTHPLRLEVGDAVQVRRGGSAYEPGRIADCRDDQLYVAYDDGGREWTSLPLVRVRPGAPPEPPLAEALPRWDVGSRVLACWFDLDWYPGVVLRAEGDRVQVLFDNGTQAVVTPDRVRSLAVSAGERVLCRWQGGPEYHPGEITRAEGEKIHIRYDDGDEEWTSVRLLRLQRDEWLPEQGAKVRAFGERVLACWFDLYWYPGVILAVDGKRLHIVFDDGDQAVVTPDRVRDLNVGVGDKVLCRWKGGPQYFPGEVTQQEGEKIHVRYDDGDEEWTLVRMVRLER